MDAVRAAAERLDQSIPWTGSDALLRDAALVARAYLAGNVAGPAAPSAEVVAAAKRLRTGWRPIDGPTRDEDVGTLVRHVLAGGRAADADVARKVFELLDDIDCCPGYSIGDADMPKFWEAQELARAALGLAPREGGR